MRKFRFVGKKPNAYRWKINPIPNEVYDWHRFKNSHGSLSENDLVVFLNLEEPDWQEVFEDPTKLLHKDTDLGYYAAIILSSVVPTRKWRGNGDMSDMVTDSIILAKELIKQLNEETK